MKCPVCTDVNLAMSTRQNIEIDYCPQCRGVWLDRGELDKLIERSVTENTSYNAPQQQYREQPRQQYREEPRQHYRKKKSIWHEIFD